MGLIKPIFKNKGNDNDPCNYRGISPLSCFQKVFASLLNNRLSNFLSTLNLLGEEQAGFRSKYGVNDHIFTLHSLIDFFLFKKKKKTILRLYKLWKTFDYVDRALLWQKLLSLNVQ